MKRIVVVGGGVAGLTAALHIKDGAGEIAGGVEVLLLEGGDRVGGNIRTDRDDGWIIECGPNGYLDNVSTTPALVKRLKLERRVQPADEGAAKRFLYRHGRLNLLATNPIAFLASPVLSLRGRLRILFEPFSGSSKPGRDETVYEFGKRHIGHEAATVLIDAMVSGVYAGNIHELSLASAFPKMAEMEAKHGSLVKAMMARGRERRAAKKPGGPAGPGGTLTSFDDGLDVLVSALARELGDSVWLQCTVKRIKRDSSTSGAKPWNVVVEGGASLQCDAVMLAVPAAPAVPLVQPLDATLADTLSAIRSAGLVVVALGYEAEAIGGAPDGFGFLVPRGTGPRILGCLWDSSLFPGRAPNGKVLLRVMIGGAHDPQAVTLDDHTLLGIVRKDLRTTMGIDAEPVLARIYRHPNGIAQYTVGHQQRLDTIHQRLERLPGLWVTGSSYYGVSMNACIARAGEQAEEILRYLDSK
ncbi:MAG: protoporphyrinogen oxidase [Gemmatimonadetes bacterium]|nr:protoporphyrinogen oxidase [Gemmatimonadota bacterium]